MFSMPERIVVGQRDQPDDGDGQIHAVVLAIESKASAKANHKFKVAVEHGANAQVQVVPDVLPHSFEEFRKTLK